MFRLRFRPARGAGLVILALLIIAWSCPVASAQEPMADQPAQVLDAAEIERLAEEVKARIKEVEGAPDLADEARAQQLQPLQQLRQLYVDARTYLEEAQAHAVRGAQFRKDREGAPVRLEAITSELAEPSVEIRLTAPPDASLAQLEQLAAQAQADFDAAKKKAVDLEAELKRRAERRLAAPTRSAEARQELEEIAEELSAQPGPEEAPALVLARRTQLAAKKQAIEAELDAQREELLSYDARRDLLAARRDQAARQVTRGEKLVEAWQEVVNERRRTEAVQKAEQARQDAARAHPAVRKLAEENAQWAESRTGPDGPAAKIARLSPSPETVDRRRAELVVGLDNVKEMVEAAGGLTKGIGLLLLGRREDLPDVRQHLRIIRRLESEMSEIQWKRADVRQRLFADIEPSVEQILAGLEPSLMQEEREDIESQARELLQARREYLDALEADYVAYFNSLSELVQSERGLVDAAKGYVKYIDQHILWVQSATVVQLSTFRDARKAGRWLVAPTGWAAVGRAAWADLPGNAVPVGAGVLVLVALLFSRRRLRRHLRAVSGLVHQTDEDSFLHTLRALALTLLIAVQWPAILLFVGWRLASVVDAPPFVGAVAAGLRSAGVVYLVLELLRAVCMRAGLADDHFRMRREARDALRKHLLWFMPVVLPLVFVMAAMQWQHEDAWQQSLGRLALIAGLIALSVFLLVLLRPSGQLMKGVLARSRGGWLDRLRHVWYALAVALPLALAMIAALGYHYTAQQLSGRLEGTILLILCVVMVNVLMVRWLVVVRRNIAVRKALEARAAAAPQAEAEERPSAEMRPADLAEPEDSLYALSRQTRQFLRAFLGFALLIGLWLIWAEVLPALGKLDEVTLWSTTVKTAATETVVPITLASLALALLIVLVTILGAKNMPGLLEIAVLQHLPLDRGVRFAVTSLSRYVIVVVGFVIAFTTIGIGWSKVQWLIAAMTVGLGFGLQEIFANFVSGLIILFERPMRVGDTVTVGDTTGTVTRIRIRATTVLDWNRKELVVPNKEFITGRLVNWTLSDTVLRMVFPVGIAYGSDTQLAEKTLLEVAAQNSLVLRDPEPVVIFTGFGTSSLEFELRLFIPNMESYVIVWHQVNRAIDDAFRKAHIEIAFPQQDVHVRSVEASFPIDVQRQQEQGDQRP